MVDEATREAPGGGRGRGPVRRLSIAVARGRDAGKMFEPEADASATVGTSADNDLVLVDPTVSRYHLELSPSADGIVVRDLDSTNGTFAGAVRIHQGVVPPGAQLRIGDTLLVVDGASAASARAPENETLPGMVFVSDAMKAVARRVRALAPAPTSVLVHGETGTGKELVARSLHDLSLRAKLPFVVVDCASLPPTLLEAELFGHERGAFTGADRARAGAFERAQGGTVFLDEIGELPLAAQGALLGVLERRRIRRVGGDKEIAIDVRVVSATNRDLRGEVNRNAFRADLFFRLAGARVVLPPLRDRADDIAPLAAHFAMEMTGGTGIADEDIAALAAQHWAGNVRELRSAVERAITFGAAGIDDETSPAEAAAIPPSRGEDAPVARYRDAKAQAVEAFERSYLAKLIARAEGNASEAARLAKMDRPYLLGLLRRYGLR
jgi:transcriptional regulator with GAF, ATPase, and Fis domain